MTEEYTLELKDELATLHLASQFAKVLKSGMVIYLIGNLGAGKTTFVRGLIHSLGYTGKVKSPTYTLVESYELEDLTLYHFDLYRFVDEEEWEASGFRDYFGPHSLCLIEWPEKAHTVLPPADMTISLTMLGDGRLIRITADSDLGKQCLKSF